MSMIHFEVVQDKTAIRGETVVIFLQPSAALPNHFRVSYQQNDAVGHASQEIEYFRSSAGSQFGIVLPRKPGKIMFHDLEKRFLGFREIGSADFVVPPAVIKQEDERAAKPPDLAQLEDEPDGGGRDHGRGHGGDGNGRGHGGNGNGAHRATVVRLERTSAHHVPSEHLWRIIKRSADGLSFPRFDRFVELAFYDHPRHGNLLEQQVRKSLHGGDDGDHREGAAFDANRGTRDIGLFFRVDSYDRLNVAAEVFLLANAGVRPVQDLSLVDRSDDDSDLAAYIEPDTTLPYLRIVYDRLGIRPPNLLRSTSVEGRAERFREVLERKSHEPCMIELIWSYWHEEAMLVQGMRAICQRFQNRRVPGERDPLAALEIDPLRPLNHLLWKHVQGESDRLSVLRRAHEYQHEYGFPLHGKAVASQRPADCRSKFLEAFHNLLYRCVEFYKEDDDTTHCADGFPVLNALKETHYVLSQGAHNQFLDLPFTARKEMIVEQWILGRPEMREFLGSRPMVAYPEAWMDRIDTVKTLKGWGDTSVVHFRDLAIFGEELLLSIRWGDWPVLSYPDNGKQWARAWRPAVQGYIHAIRATLGLDLSAKITSSRDEAERYLPPSVHLQRRLTAQSAAR